MDLSMSADFESTLLDWDDDGPSKDTDGLGNVSTSVPNAELGGDGAMGRKPSISSTQSRKDGFSRLPSFPTSIGGVSGSSDQPAASLLAQNNPNDGTGGGEATAAMTGANLTNPFAMQMLYPLTGASQDASSTGAVDGSTSLQQQQNPMVQYALTGQSAGAPFPNVSFQTNKNQVDTVSSLSTNTGNASSAASIKPPVTAAAPVPTATQPLLNQITAAAALPTSQLHPLGIQSSAVCPPLSSTSASASALNAMQFANPYLFNPYSFMAAGNPQLLAAFQSSHQQMAAQFAAAQAQMTAGQAAAAAAAAKAKPPPSATVPPKPKKLPAKPKAKPAKSSKKPSGDKKDDPPPFLLFDAPCELRQNFIQSQRMLNIPVHNDGNSYHYGMAVNGFHPQLNVATDPISPLSREQPNLPPGVKLLDSRHKKKKGHGKERNEREQKRAQKITELIEQIRVSMEDGGWKVEMKSKYHTLSMCADYVKHLMKSTEEKEEAVEKARSDLEVKERKLEEDKALLEGRSDPESVTSSLTASSARSGKEGDEEANGTNQVSETSSGSKRKAEEQLRPDSGSEANSKKAKAEESSADSSGGDDGGSGSGPQGHNISIGKMSSSVSELTDSNRGSSDSGGEKRGSHNGAAHKKHPRNEEGEGSDPPSSSSISSTAAVLRGAGSHHREHGHADVVIKEKHHSRHRKRQRGEERSSLDRKFVVDYEEVFLTSNVPQIIATPAGRIVAWNKFFLKATGLHHDAVQRLTIFSLVQPDKLPNLFEMVAEALRQKPAAISESSSTNSSSDQTTSESSGPSNGDNTESTETERTETTPQPTEYSAMTLPCTPLVSAPAASSDSSEEAKPDPLFMTVTLMPDEDVRKRCFHCVFTDCKGTDGKMGYITPALLAKLFTEPQAVSEKIRLPPPPPASSKKPGAEAKLKKGSAEMEIDADGEGDSD